MYIEKVGQPWIFCVAYGTQLAVLPVLHILVFIFIV